MAQQDALIQEALDQSFLWRLWASWKNGMPEKPHRNVIGGAKPAAEKPAAPAVSPGIAAIAAEPMRPMHIVPKLLIGATMLGGAGVLGGALNAMLTNRENPSPIVQEQEQKETAQPDGDLLRYLRQQGYHVPPVESKR